MFDVSGTTPIRRFAARVSRAMSWPWIRARPLVILVIPVSILMVVVLPAPFGPRNPNVSPIFTAKLMPFTATLSPNRLVSPITSIASMAPAHHTFLSGG